VPVFEREGHIYVQVLRQNNVDNDVVRRQQRSTRLYHNFECIYFHYLRTCTLQLFNCKLF